MKIIEIVVLRHNGSKNIRPLYEAIRGVSAEELPAYSYTLLFTGDGSSDDLLVALKKLLEEDKRVKYLSFPHNSGHRLVVKTGLDHLFVDAVVSIDCDQQHPPVLVPRPVKRWGEGNRVVTTLRIYPPDTPREERRGSHHSYKLLNMFSDIEIKEGSTDLRLLSQEIIKVIREMNENELFLRGIVPWAGFE